MGTSSRAGHPQNRWHRAGFRLYGTWVSRARRVGGRRRVSQEVRALIFRMAAENPTWGAPRIHEDRTHLGLAKDTPTVGQPRHVLWWKARFTLALGSGACTIVTRPPLRLRQLRLIGTSLPVPVGTAGDAFAMGRARGLD
jgi:hypothetical protein